MFTSLPATLNTIIFFGWVTHKNIVPEQSVHAMMSHGFISLLTRRNILPDLSGTSLGTTTSITLLFTLLSSHHSQCLLVAHWPSAT